MTTVSFKLDDSSQSVTASVQKVSDAWFRMRRVFSADTDHVQLVGDKAIAVPLWLFLARREALRYRLETENLNVQFNAPLEEALRKVLLQEADYHQNQNTKLVSALTLKSNLKASGFSRDLKPYQQLNVRTLLRQTCGATFSVPGAGKTTEALAYFFAHADRREKLIVVAPKNAFAAWEAQLALCVPKSIYKFARLVGGRSTIAETLRKSPRFSIISYRQLQSVTDEVIRYISNGPTSLFLDESHRMKGGLSNETGRTVLRLSGLPRRKLLLTGTPMPNSITDLVAQAQFLFPFININERNVRNVVRPVYVRTTKKQLGIRPADRMIRPIPMSKAQQDLYALLAVEAAREAAAHLRIRDRIQLRQMGRSVIRLLQAASNPLLLVRTGGIPREILNEIIRDEDSNKIRYACDRARYLASKGHKVVIWSTFVQTVELLADRLSDIGADFIHGGVDAGSEDDEQTRERKIRDFHVEKDRHVLVANPASCGEGISLHEVCHHAIYVDRNYNAGQYLQSEDRIHRLGLKKNQRTSIEILSSVASIDESVQRRLESKINSMAAVLNDSGLHIDPISLDPDKLSDDEAIDEADVRDLLRQLKRRHVN